MRLPETPEEESAVKTAKRNLGVEFKSDGLLLRALSHRSYVHESGHGEFNERLELLGDAVIGLLVTEALFDKYRDMEEGELTQLKSVLVSRKRQAEVALELGLNESMLLGVSEHRTGGRERISTLANVLEAIVGAIYLEQGLDGSRRMLKKTLIDRIDSIEPPDELKDPKTQLQELIQKEINEQPRYRVIRSSGPDHQPTFTMNVEIRGFELGRGSGGSKKQAERTAARNAMNRLEKKGIKAVLRPDPGVDEPDE